MAPTFIAGLGLLAVVAACGAPASPSPSASTAPSDAVVVTLPPLPTDAPVPSVLPTPVPSGVVAVDESLLDVLPDRVDGASLAFSGEASASVVAGNNEIAPVADALAYAIGANPLTGDTVVAAVIELKPGVFGDAWFRGWRDSINEGACEPAGGVAGNAEAEIDGRTVFIGTCAEGPRTYHTWLPDRGALVYVLSVGEGRLGEEVMEGLEE